MPVRSSTAGCRRISRRADVPVQMEKAKCGWGSQSQSLTPYSAKSVDIFIGKKSEDDGAEAVRDEVDSDRDARPLSSSSKHSAREGTPHKPAGNPSGRTVKRESHVLLRQILTDCDKFKKLCFKVIHQLLNLNFAMIKMKVLCMVLEESKPKQMRLEDAKQVEAKAARIKEWVANKLKELEDQNLTLREQNQKCNEQLELLAKRCTQFQTQKIGNERQRTSTEDSSRGSLVEQGDSEGSTAHPQLSASNLSLLLREGSSSGGEQLGVPSEHADSDSDPVYADVDYAKKKGSVKRTVPPRVKIERKKYQENHASTLSSSTPSSEGDGGGGTNVSKSRDSRVDSGSLDLETPKSLTPKSPLTPLTLTTGLPSSVPPMTTNAPKTRRSSDTAVNNNNRMLDNSKKKPVPPPRSRVPKKMDAGNHGSTDDSGTGDVSGGGEEEVVSSCSGQQQAGLVNSRLARAAEEDEMHDYAEIYTPSKEREPQWSSQHEIKPPTPPLHRFPSWESRIYEIASNGMTLSDSLVNGAHPDTANNNKPVCGTYANGAHPYCEISVPVYATVKGRASQIRSFPFTGDSSDSSDNEDVRVTMTTNSSHTTSGETESSLSTSSPSKSLKTGSSPSPAKQSTNTSPVKSLKKGDLVKDFCATIDHTQPIDTSVESALSSDDYAIPPDAISTDALSIDSSVEPRLLKSGSQDSPKKDSLEKSGYLTKLGGKLKTWRKRWFVLKNGVLVYYKSQNDVNRKPQGQITLDEVCRVTRAEGSATFEISTGKKTYYLTAESTATMEEWVRVLQNVLRRIATKLLFSSEENKPAIQGWLVKVKHGHSKKCWCVLIGKMFLYFKTANDTTPFGQINMRDARVEEVEHVSDSDEEDEERDRGSRTKKEEEYTIGIFPNHQGPTYLLFSSKQEKDTWLYHLTVVSVVSTNVGTQYEQLVQRLMEMEGDPSCVIWKHPLLLYSKDNISQPLTTLSSEQLQTEAVKLFKSCQLFTSVLLDSAGIDYHVVLAQNALQQCLSNPELQDEFFCQLMKQTSRHTQTKVGMQVNNQNLINNWVAVIGPRYLALPSKEQSPPLVPEIALGEERGLKVSDLHQVTSLIFCMHIWSEIGKYAIFCQRALERTKQNGCREAKPSRMEVLSILLKNPYHHSLPHSIPVHFLNGTYQVVGFDGSSTVEEFIQTLNQEIAVRDTLLSGFALFSDDPIDSNIEHYLKSNVKLADVISKWETALRENKLGKFENTRVLKLTYKNRLYLRNFIKSETEKERLLLIAQVNEEIINGRFPVSKDLALELAVLLAQIEFGDYNAEKSRGSGGTPANTQHQSQQAMDRFYPQRYRESMSTEELKQFNELFADKWIALKGRNTLDCARIYLTCTRKWSFFGTKLFSAKMKMPDQTTVWLCVSDDSISLLDHITMQPIQKHKYQSVVTFGGCRDDFMLVVSPTDISEPHTQKLLFIMSKLQILELTLLTADYVNAMNRQPPPTPLTGSLSRPESRVTRTDSSKRRPIVAVCTEGGPP
uniref:PH domain-containing protein n=1 Tax=Strigamia maritima TaxID=126957 RepID=T1J612_STRMM